MKSSELRALIQTTLKPLNLWNPDAEEVLMATCANESHLGEYREQVGGGPAKGIFQMEQEDFTDIYQNFLKYHPLLRADAASLSQTQTVDDLVNNDAYAIFMARMQYYRYPDILPDASDIEGIWTLYKKRYNTPEGAATHDAFVECYQKFVLSSN